MRYEARLHLHTYSRVYCQSLNKLCGLERAQTADKVRLTSRLKELDAWQEQPYEDPLFGKITQRQWQSLNEKWLTESKDLKAQFRSAAERCDSWYPVSQKILGLLHYLPALSDAVNSEEERRLVDLEYSNCVLDGKTLSVTYRRPFSYLAEGGSSQNKPGDRETRELFL